MLTFADKVIAFCKNLKFEHTLPEGITIMNPFIDNNEILHVITEFYRKYYSDNNLRHFIIGINPGRFGAGVTGIPFTDTVRLKEKCGLSIPGLKTYETSSVFVYEMIDRYGGPSVFYSDFYIGAVSPLGFTYRGKNGRELNYNYYDNRQLMEAVYGFIVHNLKKQLEFGILRDVCFCLGTGRNFRFLEKLNEEYKFFDKIEPLEHPRFIMQYRTKSKDLYIEKYLEKFSVIR